jgi:starch synthase (maltosyl-transferring)
MNAPVMSPAPGERLLRFVGDRLRFGLRPAGPTAWPSGWRAVLRTNLGRAAMLQREIIHSHAHRWPPAGACWRDIVMPVHQGEAALELSLTEVGYFQAKAYLVDPQGKQYWPAGPDVGLSVHPDYCRTANTIYCAFVRLFGETRSVTVTQPHPLASAMESLDQRGFTVIPPSGKLRDLTQCLPHIVDTLGCRILHLLPVNPTPTTFARLGRFGSPYAALDLAAVDPALVVFDKRTTGVDQFCELTYATHCRGARVFLDVAINHTGWGSNLQENHPEWFVRDEHRTFISPGAWGNVWEDLVELDQSHPPLWDYLADVFLVWCRRGVDGFRCDAGYKIPLPAWRYIIARVRQEFPETVFLLEGLGGSWEATEGLVTEGGMQWAYSELFQNYSGRDIARYLDYSLHQSQRAGLWIHYSETHDNDRLARQGKPWSLMRNRLCALTSVCGGFGFTCGVEWLASEQINVHQSRGLSWGNPRHIVDELSRLNRLLANHPSFFDGARLQRLSADDSAVYVLRRDSADGADRVLVLVNSDTAHAQSWFLPEALFRALGEPRLDLLGGPTPAIHPQGDGRIRFELAPAGAVCLAAFAEPQGLPGEAYRRWRGVASWALVMLGRALPMECVGACDWRTLAEYVQANPERFLARLASLAHKPDYPNQTSNNIPAAPAADRLAWLQAEEPEDHYAPLLVWQLSDARRITPVPFGHWLLVRDALPFTATLEFPGGGLPVHQRSIAVQDAHWACLVPGPDPAAVPAGDAWLTLERYGVGDPPPVRAQVRFLPAPDQTGDPWFRVPEAGDQAAADTSSAMVLLTNGRGGMARLGVDLGHIESKYDCLLGANLHPSLPTDRHVLAKRVRVWVNADGFITALNWRNLAEFSPGPPAQWRFIANAGDGRVVEIQLTVDLLELRNTVVLRFDRPARHESLPWGRGLPAQCEVRLTVRVDIEDRNFHAETHRNGGAEYHFAHHTQVARDRIGFVFAPAADRRLRVASDAGLYHHEAEWCQGIAHPVERSRGQVGEGDAYSPGWFDLPLVPDTGVTLVVDAEPTEVPAERLRHFIDHRRRALAHALHRAALPEHDLFGRQLVQAVQAFVVRRDDARTIIAGYPWFLDWGRDSLICARGLLAAGMGEEVRQLLVTFGRFEQNGTLPNSIHGEDASNRDTSDAPLWYAVVCEEAAAAQQKANPDAPSLYATPVDRHHRTVAQVLRDIAEGYIRGTPNGIRMDPESALIWSPAHFTWMDTNYPMGTPREGYPIEIQALWIRLLRQLDSLGPRGAGESWLDLARRAEAALTRYFWLEDRGYLGDLLIAKAGVPAARATLDNALRSNYLLAVALGQMTGRPARSCVAAAVRYLVVPGALRSMAPLPVSPPLPVRANDGHLLNNPAEPYWGRYEGDEDTRRKPAYHNGTAWTWTFPIFCEALARAWDFSPAAVQAARGYLRSLDPLLQEGCLGQLPELVDGDAPHLQRGCDAQAWGVTEALRVWQMLQGVSPHY